MQKKNVVAGRLNWFWGGAVGLMILVFAGCEPYDLLPEETSEGAVAQQVQQQIEAVPDTPATPETPVTEIAPPPPVSYSSFLWEPRGSNIRVVIPGSVAHSQFHVFSRILHFELYGPDYRGGNRDMDIEYILPGGPGVWAAKASSLDPRSAGQLLVYVNTRDNQATGHHSAGWRILDPYQTYRGDGGTRLQRGENR